MQFKLLLVILIISYSLNAQVQISSFPWSEHFNVGYSGGFQGSNAYAIGSVESTGGWDNGACYKLEFLRDRGDWEVGFGGTDRIDFPHTGSDRPSVINIRWLVYYSADFILGCDNEETKPLIIRRCNSDCSDHGVSSERGIVLEWYSSGYRYFNIHPNIGQGGATQPGKVQFELSDYLEQWICIEAEFNLNTATYKLYIDTQDGVQDSESGSAPYSVLTGVADTDPIWWHHVVGGGIMGYWEGFQAHTTANNYDVYIKLDELEIDINYVGPPNEFFGYNIPTVPSSVKIQPVPSQKK